MLHEKHRLRRYKTVSYELWITLNNIYPNQTAVELVYDSLSRSVSKKSESVSPDSIWKQFVSPPSANCFCCYRSNNRALIRDLLGIRAEVVISVNREKNHKIWPVSNKNTRSFNKMVISECTNRPSPPYVLLLSVPDIRSVWFITPKSIKFDFITFTKS